MLTSAKLRNLTDALKAYHKQYLQKENLELDESGTRLMINSFLTDVLGYAPIEEVKTEYMIRGTYADYVLQLKGVRHFLVEVKAYGLDLSEKHLRQAINYGANEGIEWALLTNGRRFDFYKVIFEKPISERLVFSIDLSDASKLKANAETIQYMHKISVADKGLDLLWAKCVALDPKTVAGLLHNKPVLNFLKKALKKRYKHSFSDDEIINSLNRIVCEPIQLEDIKQITLRKRKKGNGAEESSPNSESAVSSTATNENIAATAEGSAISN
jgi:hypothetical protein